ncbi:interferon-induced protein 44-like [Myripristis murdjan]|uniref:interferon-induced protein 44-like n=1 Tax=Myripristis murdjan TaxID=586833 RepID=UPI001175C9C3|nr:interferon-induced protein 44-like [Myripristis murdjan]
MQSQKKELSDGEQSYVVVLNLQPPHEPPHHPNHEPPEVQLVNRDKDRELQYVKNYKPKKDDVQHLRVLVHGPVGAGKSSFIDSVDSVLRGRIAGRALAEAEVTTSFTKQYKTYKIPKGQPGEFYPFVFSDTMGLEMKGDRGVHAEDIKLALKGRVKDGYRFNPASKLSDDSKYYNAEPTKNDKVHVLVCVVPADNILLLTKDDMRKIKDIRETASELGIPQLAVLTRIDLACQEIQKDLKNVYKSKNLKKTMEQFSQLAGIPMNCIFPVKNYDEEINIKDDVDSLILSVLRRIISSGEDFINDMETKGTFIWLSEMCVVL